MKLTISQERKIIHACTKGVKIDELASQFEVSPRTVDRIITKHRAQGTVITVKRGRPRKPLPTDRVVVERAEPDSAIVEEVVKELIRTPFPYPDRVSAFGPGAGAGDGAAGQSR